MHSPLYTIEAQGRCGHKSPQHSHNTTQPQHQEQIRQLALRSEIFAAGKARYSFYRKPSDPGQVWKQGVRKILHASPLGIETGPSSSKSSGLPLTLIIIALLKIYLQSAVSDVDKKMLRNGNTSWKLLNLYTYQQCPRLRSH